MYTLENLAYIKGILEEIYPILSKVDLVENCLSIELLNKIDLSEKLLILLPKADQTTKNDTLLLMKFKDNILLQLSY